MIAGLIVALFVAQCGACPAPLISFVVPARNDNYGGSALDRVQVFMDVMSKSVPPSDCPLVELVVVDWNTPTEDGKSLRDELPRGIAFTLVEVPPSVHNAFSALEGNFTFPGVHEYIAKNVGIRHSTGEYIACMNMDALISMEGWKFLLTTPLRKDRVYRMIRHDSEVPMTYKESMNMSAEEVIAALRSRIKRVAAYELSSPVDVNWTAVKARAATGQALTEASGDFTMANREIWFKLRGYPEYPTYAHFDSIQLFRMIKSGVKQELLMPPIALYHMHHGGGTSKRLSDGSFVRATPYLQYRYDVELSECWGLIDRPEVTVWRTSTLEIPSTMCGNQTLESELKSRHSLF